MFYCGNNLFSNSQLKNDSIWKSAGVKEVDFLFLLFDRLKLKWTKFVVTIFEHNNFS